MNGKRINKGDVMKKIYAYILYAVLGVGVALFAWLYFRGPQGLLTLQDMYAEHETMREGVQQLQQEVATLKHEIDTWQKHPFHKEKIAREQLQMARTDDEVFYLT
jgi:cell division protein FtsB